MMISTTKMVVVIGGSRGIGAEIVRSTAAAGHDVLFTFRNSQKRAEALRAELEQAWPERKFSTARVDLANRNEVEDLARRLSEMDVLYALVHNAGHTYDALVAMLSQDEAERLMQVNFWSLTRLAAASVRPMIRARSGRIVCMGSLAALHGMRGNGAYAASKGAMLSYVRTAAIEFARKGVTVNFVAPGYVDTDMLASYAAQRQTLEQQIPAGRFARPQEVAALVRYLLGPDAAYITGAVMTVDGGLSAGVAINN